MSETQLDVIFTAPHPDDLEIGMGGTIAKLVKQGYRVGMVDLNPGEPTPRGDPQTRAKEAANAAAILGVAVRENLGLPNRILMDGPEARYALATVFRRYRPRIVVTMAGKTVSASPDHYQGQLIAEAARFHSQLTKWDERFSGTKPFRIDHLVYRPVSSAAEIAHWPTTFVVDVTETIDQKIQAVACYPSQFDDERFERIEHHIRASAGVDGGRIGVRYGELYALPRPLGITDLVTTLGVWQVPPPFPIEPRP